MEFKPTDEQKAVLDAPEQTILVTARPGRGKTTLALNIAEQIILGKKIEQSQQVLFLTFSRNAVYQIEQASGDLSREVRSRLWIATYHSFMWWLLSIFGRFHNLPRILSVMGETKARLGNIIAQQADVKEAQRGFYLANTMSAISYDDFAPLALDLLRNSHSLCRILQHRFPIVIVDEFQDTNAEQWELIKAVSQDSRLYCFADPDQMIYRWRGASGDRINQLFNERQAKQYNLQQKSWRTDRYDLLDYAEEILDNKPTTPKERIKRRSQFLRPYHGTDLGFWLKRAIQDFYKDFQKRNAKDQFPTIAIATYTNSYAKSIQAALAKPTPKARNIYRCSLLQSEEDNVADDLLISLAIWLAGGERANLLRVAQLVGSLLTPNDASPNRAISSLIRPDDLFDGRIKPIGTAKYVLDIFGSLQPLPAISVKETILLASDAIQKLRERVSAFAGAIPEEDLLESRSKAIQLIDGELESSSLSALRHLQDKLGQEHLRRNVLDYVVPVRGIVSSTLHKLKGREFDYVCVVTRGNDTLRSAQDDEHDARRLLYVALTRARFDARIFYVESNPCTLLAPYL